MMNRTPSVYFGLVGKITLNCEESSAYSVDFLLQGFKEPERSVVVVWCGKHFNAVAVQHPEDARQHPGVYEANPSLGNSCEGLIYGQFFGDCCPQEKQQMPFPVAVSYHWGRRYVQEGMNALANLNGAWVAVFWDGSKHQLVVARDRVGVETIYVARNGKQVVFATDLRLLKLLGLKLTIDEQSLAEFLHYLYVPSPRTIYKEVKSVLPGHALIADSEEFVQESFTVSRFQVGRSVSDRKELDAILASKLPQFQERLFGAVQDSLLSSGRIGLFLSGGKDSSALAIVLKHLVGSRVVAITAQSPNRQLDESVYASKIAKFLGLEHWIYNHSDDELFENAGKLFPALGQPIGDPALIPLIAICRQLPEDITVVFDGTGNDFYFGITRPIGRQIYEWRRAFDRLVPRIILPVLLNVLKYVPFSIGHLARAWIRPIEESFVSWNGWTQAELSKLIGHQVSFADTYLWQTMRRQSSQGWQALQTQVICGIWEPHAAYAKVVCAARETGRTVRFPFTDNRLARFVNELPQPLQFEGATNKVLLRAFLQKHLPPELLERPKGSFVLERTRLLEYGDRAWIRALERDNPLVSYLLNLQ